jgi:hypothetical protein
MKIYLLILSLASSAQAYEGFHCVPSARETHFQVLVQEKNIEVTVTNSMGYEMMPQFDGPSSIFNISFNKMQGEDLKDLGQFFTFTWPKADCKIDNELFTIQCRSEAQNTVKSVKSYGLTTTEVSEKYEDEKYEKRKFRFSLEKDNFYFVTLQFNVETCKKFN